MNSFGKALEKAGIVAAKDEGYDKGKSGDYSIRRAIAEFQSMFEKECQTQSLDDAVSSMADRNEIVHVYENYRGNMERVLENVQNYRTEYEQINEILWDYCRKEEILLK